jgi:hypothetical protein
MIDYAAIAAAGGIPKNRQRTAKVVDDDHATRSAKKRLEAAYAIVDARDQGKCRVTGRLTVKGSRDQNVRREHHHLFGRNVRPEFVYDAARIILVSSRVHKYLQAHEIEVEGDDASKVLLFRWAARWDGKPKPFRILTRNRSAQPRGRKPTNTHRRD